MSIDTLDMNTPIGEPEPAEWRTAIDHLSDHLDNTGELCSDSSCPHCGNSLVGPEVNRLRVARFEYNVKVASLRRSIRVNLCAYCGDASSDRDHLLPKWWTGGSLRRHVPTVAACRSCNGILSDFPEPIIAARSEHIAANIRKRAGKQLNRFASLEGLRGNLRKQIAANHFNRGRTRGRLAVLELGGVPEIPEAWQDMLILDGPIALDPLARIPLAQL